MKDLTNKRYQDGSVKVNVGAMGSHTCASIDGIPHKQERAWNHVLLVECLEGNTYDYPVDADIPKCIANNTCPGLPAVPEPTS